MSPRTLAVSAVFVGAALVLAAGDQLVGWPTQALALVALAGALLTMIIGGRRPTGSGRYGREDPDDDETTWWRALDAGIDPTVDSRPSDPDVHIRASPDTMEKPTSPSSRPGESEEPHGRHGSAAAPGGQTSGRQAR
jgi:hypothetical protein